MDTLAIKIPVTLITGFLGSGKTTLISRLIRHPGMNRVAVVINEVGEIGIDHDLVAQSSENVSLLANGCLCCTVRTDLQETLRELFGQRRSGQIPDFDRVVIETTGLADPAPVIQTLAADTMLNAHYRLDGVVSLVDAVHGAALLARQPEAVKQVAVADLVLVTKSDLPEARPMDELREAIRQLNTLAPVESVVMGELEPARLMNLGLSNARGDPDTLRFLGAPVEAETAPGTMPRYLGEAASALHDRAIRTHTLTFDEPFTWQAFAATLDMIINMRGEDLLRVKGIVNVEGEPVVVQGVQHIMHPAVPLAQWPSADRRTRMVFITRRIKRRAIQALFDAVTGFDT